MVGNAISLEVPDILLLACLVLPSCFGEAGTALDDLEVRLLCVIEEEQEHAERCCRHVVQIRGRSCRPEGGLSSSKVGTST